MKIQQGVMLDMLPIKNMASAAILYFFSILEKGITADSGMCTLAMMNGWKCTINYTAR
jgi:Mg2+/citrate symporter